MTKNTQTIPFKRQNKRSVVMIVATSLDHVIGKDNTIPWTCKTDMLFFKKATTGNIIIMGRNTFESMRSKPLPGRINIVISTTLTNTIPGVTVVKDLDSALEIAQSLDISHLTRNTCYEHIFIIGGGQIYVAAFDFVDEILHSVIDIRLSDASDAALVKVPLYTWLDNIQYESEVLYYNKVYTHNDKTSLKEIVQCSKTSTRNKFELKDKI